MSAIWPWPQWVVASRGVPRTRVPPDPACAGAWQALVKSYVLCWVSPPPGKSQCGAVGLSRPHTAAGHHMRGANSSGITEPREPGEEAGAPAPRRGPFISPLPHSPFHLCLSGHALFSSAAFALFALGLFSLPSPQPFPLHLAVLAASALLLSLPSSWTLCFHPLTPSCLLPPSCTGVLPPCRMCPSITSLPSPRPPFAMGEGED